MRGQYQGVRWIECYNASGYVIPSHSLVTISGADLADPGRTVIRVTRAGADHAYPVAITNHAPIAEGDYGLCTLEGPAFVTYDDAETPVVGEAWGTASGSFKATLDKNGLLILGGLDSTRKIVLADICRWEQYQPGVQFRLAEALEITDENVTATISTEYGPGRSSPYSSSGEIVVHNMPRNAGGYEFYGDEGDYGRGIWMYGNHVAIYIIECP